jgi:hypothetical protein
MQGGKVQPRVACRRTRAPRRPGNLAGDRNLRRRVDRPLRHLSAATAVPVSFASSGASRRRNPRG